MGNKLLVLSACAVLILSVAADTPPAQGARRVTGRIVGIDGGLVRISLGAAGQRRTPSSFISVKVDSQPAVVVDRIAGDGVARITGVVADLHVGQEVQVSSNGARVVQIHVLLPPPVQGEVISADSNRLSVMAVQDVRDGPQKPHSFAINGRTAVTLQIGGGPHHQTDLSSLVPGRYVSVYESAGAARLVQIIPAPPVAGEIVRLDGKSVTVRLLRGKEANQERAFTLSETTKVIFRYFGMASADGVVSDLKAGQHVSVAPDLHSAIRVTIEIPPVYGKVGEVRPDGLSVIRNGGGDGTPSQSIAFAIEPGRTAVFLGKISGTFLTPDGKTGYWLHYERVDTYRELQPGREVSVTARNGVALAIRIAPNVQARKVTDHP